MKRLLPTLTVLCALSAAALPTPSAADTLSQDKDALMDCVAEAFPEGDLPQIAGAPKANEPSRPGDCIGLIERSDPKACASSSACFERETKAWLAIARGYKAERGGERNKAAINNAVAGIERQAKALCIAAAATSAWGAENVAKGKYSVGLDSPCMRDAVAGMVTPMIGYARGN